MMVLAFYSSMYEHPLNHHFLYEINYLYDRSESSIMESFFLCLLKNLTTKSCCNLHHNFQRHSTSLMVRVIYTNLKPSAKMLFNVGLGPSSRITPLHQPQFLPVQFEQLFHILLFNHPEAMLMVHQKFLVSSFTALKSFTPCGQIFCHTFIHELIDNFWLYWVNDV